MAKTNENLLGDKILPKRKKESGKPKTILFSKVVLNEHKQLNILNEWETHSLKVALSKSFANCILGHPSTYEIEGEQYNFTLFQYDERYWFFSIGHTKQFNDILAEPIDSNTEKTIEKKNMMLRYYTFILVDSQSHIIAYLNNRNLPNINALVNLFLIMQSNINLYIEPLKNPKIKKTVRNALKTKELVFTLNTTLQENISKNLDETCHITRNSEAYKITVSVKSPGEKLVNSILDNPQKVVAFQKAKINIIDENNIPQMLDLFSSEFSFKTNIAIDDIDLKENQKVKIKLIDAIDSLKDVVL